MAQAITAPGDVVLVPNPSYPIHAFGFLMAGGVIRSVPSEPTPAFFSRARAGDRCTRSRSRSRSWSAIRRTRPPTWPTSISTGSSSPFAKKHGIFVLSDLAYAEVYFDGNPPPSVLQVPGAMDVAVEFTSMSKTYSMPGWRIGFAVGNERIIAALARVKSYLDYGAFTPIQVAATAALNGPDDCIRRDARDLQAPARRAGRNPSAAPAGRSRRRAPRCSPGRRSRSRSATLGSVEFSKLLVEKAERRGLARHRLRRAWRGLCAHRAGRERAAHPPGRPQHPALS